MKPLYYITLFFLLFAFALESTAQETQEDQPGRRTRTRETETTEQQKSGLPDLTERARIKNSVTRNGPENAVWLREVYRSIDLEQENNAALLYPIQPIGNRMNLFTTMFRLLNEGKIKAYVYEDGREVFTDDMVINFKDLLDKYQIYYVAEGNQLKVEDVDIPSNEVQRYMIKEAFYVDEATGTYNSTVIAICPLLVRIDYYTGATQSDPLFWIPYEELRPYLSRELIMTSNYNNALTYTMDDYFTKRMYSGEIIKTTNLMNLTLDQEVARKMEKIAREQAEAMAGMEEEIYYDEEGMEVDEVMAEVEVPQLIDGEVIVAEGDSIAKPLTREDYLKLAQDSIELQLKAFNEGMWVYNDSIAKQQAEEKSKGKKKKSSKSKEDKSSGKKAKESKSDNAAPTRSVRRGK